MTQEEKSLLLQDICARLPYGVVIEYNNDGYSAIRELGLGSLHDFMFDNAELKPYLRSMSSMTEEEKIEYQLLCDYHMNNNGMKHYFNNIVTIDWYHQKHLDCRGLIKLGLAIEAPKGMYNVNYE